MKNIVQVMVLIASIWMVGAVPGFAQNQNGQGQNGNSQGGGAPAPAIGAGIVGLLVAGGVAFYIRRHRRG